MKLVRRLRLLITVAALGTAIGCSSSSSAQGARLGTVDFPTSGSAEAKPHFIRGVLFLHSFEYDSAAREFRRAESADPGFAMAYWGEAMTHTHPVWNEQDLAAARGILAKLGASPAARKAKAPTHREQMYLDAVETLYGEGSKEKRDTLYSAAMKKIVDAHPEDTEAKAFYALSLLGLNQGIRDVKTYLRAGEIAEEIFKANPDHPGAAHYVIHSYDDPAHAALGLTAAREYSKIAPGAAHAQHMTTHIFLAMGMWDDVVSQNEIASGHDHDAWTPNHYTQWLNYAYIQQGRYADAEHMLEMMKAHQPRGQQAGGFIGMRARYLIDTEQWDSPVATWPADFSSLGPYPRVYWAFAKGLKAARTGDAAAAASALAELISVNDGADEPNKIIEMQLSALVKFAQGKRDEALAIMRNATQREDAMPVEFGPPVVLKPTHELYGELLLEAGKPGEAYQQFTAALKLAPRRARSLVGLARSAKAMGDSVAANKAFAELKEVWHRADKGVASGS
jgi:tetratricopeptide (TPR) repeat protein